MKTYPVARSRRKHGFWNWLRGSVRQLPSRVWPRLQVERLEERAVLAAFADFNGDGFHDMAVGVPFADDNEPDAGAVHVIFGSEFGLLAFGAEILTQDSLAIDASEEDDRFGFALAAGDFNGDGLDDLAIGAPGEDGAAGAVYVLYGS